MRSTVLSAICLWAVACGGAKGTGTAPDAKIGSDPVSHVQLTIGSISKEDADLFRKSLEDQGDVENIQLKSWQNGTALYELDVKGCECDLPQKIGQIQYPGFKYEGRVTQVRYSAFDNKPPTVAFVFPQEGKVLTESEQYPTVEIPDQDVSEVTINGVKAEHFKGNLWRVRLVLKDGVTDIEAVATDRAGNIGKATVRAAVDTTPPSIEATVKIVVEGSAELGSTVLIDGREIQLDPTGHYHAEVPIRKGQKQLEIVAVDKNGNKNVTMKDIGN